MKSFLMTQAILLPATQLGSIVFVLDHWPLMGGVLLMVIIIGVLNYYIKYTKAAICLYLLISTLVVIISVPIWGFIVAMSSMLSDSGESARATLVMIILCLLPIFLIFITIKSWLNYVRGNYRVSLLWNMPSTVIAAIAFMLVHGDFLSGSYDIGLAETVWLLGNIWLMLCLYKRINS